LAKSLGISTFRDQFESQDQRRRDAIGHGEAIAAQAIVTLEG